MKHALTNALLIPLLVGCVGSVVRSPSEDRLVLRKQSSTNDGMSIQIDLKRRVVLVVSQEFRMEPCPEGFAADCVISEGLNFAVPNDLKALQTWSAGGVVFNRVNFESNEILPTDCTLAIRSKPTAELEMIFFYSQTHGLCEITYRYPMQGKIIAETYVRDFHSNPRKAE